MEETPLLFHLHRPTTTRTIAQIVKEHGAGGLTEAQRRADNARYQEVTCRSALNQVEGMPFRWTLNPYRGCTHACHYCFARRYQTQFEMSAGDDFSSIILVKTNFAEVLRAELAKPSWTRELAALGTATDPYQPIEGHYNLSRRSLEALADWRTPVGIVTKGPLAVRDADVMQDVARRAGCTIYFSVPSVDENAWASLEPGTAHPMQRLRAMRQLRDAGIDAGVLMAPIVPGISSSKEALERTVKAIADHGAAFVGMNVLFLEGGTRDHFMNFLAREYPNLIDGYQQLYARKYPPQSSVSEVRGFVASLQQRYVLQPRRGKQEAQEDAAPQSQDAARQTAFEWDTNNKR